MSEVQSLRDRLIEAGLALLEEGGMAALTLRQTAARAGVSHAAPAHHFDGLPGLLTAMAARAFSRFADATHAGRESGGADPGARLLGTTQGYLDFAARHAGLFHLMFVSPEVDRRDPAVAPHAARAYLILREACLPFNGGQPDAALEVAVWSMVHGYATLGFSNPDLRRGPIPERPPFADLLAQLLATRKITA